jgi:ABC-type glycerol-3-phosphate transport system substrate-binding protein
MNTFQTIVLGAFIVFLLLGVGAFALFRGSNSNTLPTLVVWGTFPEEAMTIFSNSATLKAAGVTLQYVEKDGTTFESEFVDALASGRSPDLVILPESLLLKEENKLLPIPSASLSERDFKDTFIDGAEIFWTPQGAIGLPFAVDPLVMYWNRSMFSSKALSTPPKHWDEFFTLAPKFNEKDDAGNIKKTIVALGDTINITNFKELLSGMILQAGDPITAPDQQGNLKTVLSDTLGMSSPPAEAALRFYTEFSNPVNAAYSWNKSLPGSSDAFIGEELATYFGFASELKNIRSKNPNLDFDVTVLPQIRDSKTRLTYGKLYALVIPKQGKNTTAAVTAVLRMASSDILRELENEIGLPPVRRDLLSTPPSDPYSSVFYASAIMAKSWKDPSPEDTTAIFKEMVESIISGKDRISGALNRANSELGLLIRNLVQ